MRVGIKVTLRSKRMWDFWDRLVNLSFPRIRDFRGISPNSFDGNGNYNLGIKEHIIFPEIDYGKVDKIRSFQLTVATSAKTDQEGFKLLQLLGMPFMEGKMARKAKIARELRVERIIKKYAVKELNFYQFGMMHRFLLKKEERLE